MSVPNRTCPQDPTGDWNGKAMVSPDLHRPEPLRRIVSGAFGRIRSLGEAIRPASFGSATRRAMSAAAEWARDFRFRRPDELGARHPNGTDISIKSRIYLFQVVVGVSVLMIAFVVHMTIRQTNYYLVRVELANHQLGAITVLAVNANRFSEQIAEYLADR